MKHPVPSILIILTFLMMSYQGEAESPDTSKDLGFSQGPYITLSAPSGQLPGPGKAFIENLGQIDDPSVIFYTEGDPSFMVRRGSISLCHPSSERSGNTFEELLRLEFAGSSTEKVIGKGTIGTVHNFYLSEQESDWIELAPSYQSVVLKEAYPLISIVVILEDGWPKYELHCEPGSDPTSISVIYHGASSLSASVGTMLDIHLDGMHLIEGPLVAYQGTNGIGCTYGVCGNIVTFDIAPYDGSSVLVIDPLLKASTYIGGNSWDRNAKLEKGPLGDIYLVGNVESYDLYTHPGSQDPTHGGERDIYICRMNEDLSSILFATYLGGSLYDDPADICLDGNGNVIVSGLTNSTNFPTTASAFDRTYNGGGSDAFISSFDSQLGTMRFSTYVGGNGIDYSRGTGCTTSGEPMVVGLTSSDDLPVTTGAYQTTLKGDTDIFILKLKADGSSALNCTYLGGSSWGELPYTLEIDQGNRPVIAGHMLSEDYPTTAGAFQEKYGFYMGFVTKLDPDLKTLDFSTFFGNGTWIRDIELDGSGNIYMTGRTVNGGGHFPATPGAFDTSFTGEEDAFIARLSWNGSKVDFASFLGADENYGGQPNFDYYEGGLGVYLLADGRPAVCGYTDSTFFPLSPDAFDRTRNEQDAFITVFRSDCSGMDYSTFMGGRDEDTGTSVLFSAPNMLYLAGETYSNYPAHDFPVTDGAYDTTFSVGYDLFITAFKLDSFLPGPPQSMTADWGNMTIDLTWEEPSSDGGEPILGYRIYRGTNPASKKLIFETATNLSYHDANLTNGIRYHYSVKARNKVGEGVGADASAVPMTTPGPPLPYHVRAGNAFLNFSFSPPMDRGGAVILYYDVFLSNGTGPYVLVVSGLDRLFYNASGLMNGRTYNISVSASNLAGEGPRSVPFGGVPRKRPGPPMDLKVAPFSGGALLSWSPPLDDGGAWNLTYRVYGGRSLSDLVLLRWDLVMTSSEVRSLENGRDYHFIVAAVNEMGEGPSAGPIVTNPLGIPSEPWNLTASEGGDHVVLKWTAPNASGGYVNLTYEIRFSADGGFGPSTIKGTEAREQTVWGLEQGIHHTFSVRAFNTRSFGPWSSNVSITPFNRPGPPTDLKLVPGDGTLNLSWGSPIDNGGDPGLLYEVHLGERNDSLYLRSNTTDLSLYISGLVNGKTYFLKVRARNVKGFGPFSVMITGIPMKVPSAPETLRCQIGDRSINVTWERPGDDGGDPRIGYDVLFGPKGSVLDTIRRNMGTRSLVIDELVNGLEYEVSVVAINSMGRSPPTSTFATPMTVPGSPATLNATWDGIAIIVRWLPPADDGGGAIWIYHIYRGEEPTSLKNVMKVDSSSRSWTDHEVVKGRTYFYSIRAENPLGLGKAAGPVKAIEPVQPKTDKDVPWAYLGIGALILFLVIFIIVMFLLSRKEKRRDWEE
ncbi:MAG: fibronectin type III domain-containing protein [Candidatus Thermoplasmatota archaeon]|jgi:hypothetical protein|nr:fibronectin type III domain-containing protein [Candidatus Thermoplasmatota archaeon]